MMNFPLCVVVSAHGSESDWNFAPASRIVSIVSRRSRVDRTRRSSFQTTIVPSGLICFFAIATLISSNGVAGVLKPESLTAGQILTSMADTYKSCKSYSDSGIVKTTYKKADGNKTDEKPFTTAFIRPDRFRFEFRDRFEFMAVNIQVISRENHYIVWRQGKEVQAWWDINRPPNKKPESLGVALGGATGVSGGSAHTIPALLLPENVHGRRLTDVAEAIRMDDARPGTFECFRIQGKFACVPITLWIEKETFLIRRIDTQMTFANFSADVTTTYEIKSIQTGMMRKVQTALSRQG